MKNEGKIDAPLTIRLVGAAAASAGLFLTAFQYMIAGAILIGIGGVLMAIGDKV